jgi:hypothetical protein
MGRATTTAKRLRSKAVPPSAPRLIRRQVHSDGSVTLQVRRNGESPWTTVCIARPGDPHGVAELDSRQTTCANPLMRALYLDQPAHGITAGDGAVDLLALFDDTAPIAIPPPISADREARSPISALRDLTATRADMLAPKAGPSNRHLPAKRLMARSYAWIIRLSRGVATYVLPRAFSPDWKSPLSY